MSARSRDLSHQLLNGPITRSLFRLAWPVMLSNSFQTAYNFIDRFWLGRYDPLGIAALSLSWPLVFLVIAVGSGMTIAGMALVAQYTGAQRSEDANLASGQVIAFTTLLAAVLAIIGIFVARPILSLQSPDVAVVEAATGYLQIIYAGIPLVFGTFVITALLNGVGDTITPMILMGISVGLNIALDPFFIFGWGPFPEWGIQRAAVATVLSRAALTAVGFFLLFTGRLGLHVRPHHLRLRWRHVRQIFSIGSLASVGQSATAVGFAFMNRALGHIGTPVLTAFGIGNSFISIVLMPVMGLGQATATMVGQNLGADQSDRARKSAWTGVWLSTAILAAAAVVVLILRTSLVRIFITDPEVLATVLPIADDMFVLVAFAFPFMGIIQVAMGTYQGSGHTFYSMFFGLFRLWVLRVPLVYLLGFAAGMGANGVWWAMLASNFGTAVLSATLLRSGNWMKRVIKEPAALEA